MLVTARISIRRVMLLFCLAVSASAFTQAPATTTAPQSTTTPAPPQKPVIPPIPPVTTTVVVRGEANGDYLPDSVTVGTIDSAPLLETPLSAPSSPATCSTIRSLDSSPM